MEKVKLTNWQLGYGGKLISAAVPGDITMDLYKAGIVKNPYFGDNQKENDWIPREDFTYITEIEADEDLLMQESVQLVFNGIDGVSCVSDFIRHALSIRHGLDRQTLGEKQKTRFLWLFAVRSLTGIILCIRLYRAVPCVLLRMKNLKPMKPCRTLWLRIHIRHCGTLRHITVKGLRHPLLQ